MNPPIVSSLIAAIDPVRSRRKLTIVRVTVGCSSIRSIRCCWWGIAERAIGVDSHPPIYGEATMGSAAPRAGARKSGCRSRLPQCWRGHSLARARLRAIMWRNSSGGCRWHGTEITLCVTLNSRAPDLIYRDPGLDDGGSGGGLGGSAGGGLGNGTSEGSSRCGGFTQFRTQWPRTQVPERSWCPCTQCQPQPHRRRGPGGGATHTGSA